MCVWCSERWLNMAKEVTRVTFNLPSSLVDQVDAYGESMHINRTSAVSVLLSMALNSQKAMSDMSDLLKLLQEEQKKAE